MNTEEKIYSLMAQAEDIQAHAGRLQNEAETTFAALPLAVEQAGQKIRSLALLEALLVFAIGVVCAAVAVVTVWWITANLRDEVVELRQKIQQERATLAELQAETWGIKLQKYTEGGLGIILPKGVKLEREVDIENGKTSLVLKR